MRGLIKLILIVDDTLSYIRAHNLARDDRLVSFYIHKGHLLVHKRFLFVDFADVRRFNQFALYGIRVLA